MIRSVYNYFRKTVQHIGSKEDVYTADFLDDASLMKRAAQFLCHVDTGISGIESKINNVKRPKFMENFPEEVLARFAERAKRSFLFSHVGEDGKVELFRQSYESEGTQKLFSLLPLLLMCFDTGGVLVVDELDNSFHPHIAELLIRLFNDAEVNTRNAQLIFSTHNVKLMTPDSLRRDQIWFVRKEMGSSLLYSLDQFDKEKVKAGSPYSVWYDEGRFGAIPTVHYRKIAELLAPANVSEEKKVVRRKRTVRGVANAEA